MAGCLRSAVLLALCSKLIESLGRLPGLFEKLPRHASVESAVKAFEREELLETVENALEQKRLKGEVQTGEGGTTGVGRDV
jgi:hypothetical protein